MICGPPGSGKTSLAVRLGERIPAPTLFKDTIKEGISLTEGATGTYGGSIAERTFASLYACVEVLVSNGCTTIVEAAFHRDFFEHEIGRFLKMADLRIVRCRVPDALAGERYRERAASGDPRRAAHPDARFIAQIEAGTLPWEQYEVELTDVPTIDVDTAAEYEPSLDTIVRFVLS